MRRFLTVAGIMLGMNIFSFAQDHHRHAHRHEGGKGSAANVDQVNRFTPDANLKSRMEKILDTVKALHHIENSKQTEKAKESGKKIEATVHDIFKNCKLEPIADAAIHPVLGAILDGADFLKKGKLKEGQSAIDDALERYEESFDHKGWSRKNVAPHDLRKTP